MPPDQKNGGERCALVVQATNDGVRQSLLDIRSSWEEQGVGPGLCDKAEQVLAEALNNVVEHAQADTPGGKIILETVATPRGLGFSIRDDGAPMPNGELPAGVLKKFGDDLDDLPEGGFGWFMIRSLTSDLAYERREGWNHLNFQVPSDTE